MIAGSVLTPTDAQALPQKGVAAAFGSSWTTDEVVYDRGSGVLPRNSCTTQEVVQAIRELVERNSLRSSVPEV